jgi:hypothetical protein
MYYAYMHTYTQRKFIRSTKKAKQRGRLWARFQTYLDSIPEQTDSTWEVLMEEDRELYKAGGSEDYSSSDSGTSSTDREESDEESD